MLQITRSFVFRIGAVLMAIWLGSAPSGALADDARPRFDQSALDAMIAPIALYPDQLLTQVLMAATYPQEVEDAAQWSRARPGLSGDAAVRAAEGWDWDPSVRSLTAFPHVLDTMAQHMAWTEDLGHAFVVQPQDVMDTVQRLRLRAYEAGTLASTEYTRVINTGSGLIIESVQPQIVYVPHYDTQVVYGSWWWPSRPPMYWPRWHGYYDSFGRPGIVHWGPGTWVNSGFFFGGFDWPRREVRIVNTRSYYYAPREAHRPAHVHPAPHVWRHDQARRSAWRQHAQQPTERPIRGQPRAPQARQEASPAGARAPRDTRQQADGGERRVRRARATDDDGRRQASPAGARAPREARQQADGGERRVRRMREPDDDSNARVNPATRSGANPPAPASPVTRAPVNAPNPPSAPRVQAPAPGPSASPAAGARSEGTERRQRLEERRRRGRDSD